MKTEHLCRTHIFLSVAHLITDHHTHLRAAQVWDVLHLKKVIHSQHVSLEVLDPLPSFCSTPPPTSQTSQPMTGIRRSPCATPHGGFQFGHLVEPTPLTFDEGLSVARDRWFNHKCRRAHASELGKQRERTRVEEVARRIRP